MNNATDIITKEQEEKRLKDFKEIAENWDKFPERVQGKIDGVSPWRHLFFWIGKRRRGEEDGDV